MPTNPHTLDAALEAPKKQASGHAPEHEHLDDNALEKAPEVQPDPGPTGKPDRGIDPPARKPEPKLVTEAVESVVEWHRQRAAARANAGASPV